MTTEEQLYQERVEAQIAQYKDVEEIHDLPEIFHYWSSKYLLPKVASIFGISGRADILSHFLLGDGINKDRSFSFASLGAGDCSIEIEVAQSILKSGIRNFCIDAFELSPPLLDRAASALKKTELTAHFNLIPSDINEHEILDQYDGAMAHFSLHHFVALERIFDNIKRALRPRSNFLIFDAIGRNGHMRWPEVLRLVEAFWRTLPDEKKYHHQFQTRWDEYINWDCSSESFEGVRAQDILPLLIERFHFSHFAAAGGLVDVFIDRGVGHNFDINNKHDIAFIDAMEYLNQLLLEAGVIKPTLMFANMRNEPCECKHEKNLTPAYCVRPPLTEESSSETPLFAPKSSTNERKAWPTGDLAPYRLAGRDLSRRRHTEIEEILDRNCLNQANGVQRFYWNYNFTEFSGHSFWRNAYSIELQATFTPQDGRLLDLGCLGPELVALRQVRPDIRADGLSIEGGIFGLEEDGFCSYPTPKENSVTVWSVDAERERFPFDDNAFDTVSSFEMLEHLKFGPENVMREIHRVLKQDGIFVVTTPNAASIRSLWAHCKGSHPATHHKYFRDLNYGVVHPFEYRLSELAALVTGYGFEILESTAFYRERYVSMAHEMSRVFDFIKSLGFSPSEADLGEHLLIVARKSGPVVNEYPSEVFEGSSSSR